MVNTQDIHTFLKCSGALVDVRSPCEYRKGHIPGAINIPLFSDEERAAVGTTYKEKGPHPAFTLGIQYVGPKLATLIQEAQACSADGTLRLYCARGGMRSRSVSEMLASAGLKVTTLQHGYKAFRQLTLNSFSQNRIIRLIGGFTGSGKTKILSELKKLGEQVIDLEQLANHRGSTFGNITQGRQPGNQHFENMIAMQWNAFDPSRPIWLEDESRFIGMCKIPDALYWQIQQAPIYVIKRPLSERLEILKEEYLPAYEENTFIAAVDKIRDRLGGERAKLVIGYLRSHMFKEAVEMLLAYYDAAYLNAMERRKGDKTAVQGEGLSNAGIAEQLAATKKW